MFRTRCLIVPVLSITSLTSWICWRSGERARRDSPKPGNNRHAGIC